MAHSELLRYLGYSGQELSPELEARIDAMEARCLEVARPASTSRAFAFEELPLELPGDDIARHLRGAVEVTLFAVTLGLGVDRELRRLSLTDPDRMEAQVRSDAAARGLFCSWRFSPGYGDLPLDVQPALLAVLDATRRLGITLTPSNLMVPTKSVTAIVGLHPIPQLGLASSCAVCSLAECCTLRASGVRCV